MLNSPAKQRLNQILILIFLVLVVIGFTVPAFLYSGEEETTTVEPRVCRSDSDCYLFCNDKPVMVLCSQNLCQQNVCVDNRFTFNESPRTISLEININNTNIDLSNTTLPGNLFVRVKSSSNSPPELELYNQYLSLNQILEKFQAKLERQCLTIFSQAAPQPVSQPVSQSFCNLKLFVNGKQDYAYGNYVPQNNDEIKII
jgi:hypothetical protein